MIGTVKNFKDAIEEMKSIYPFDESKTRLSTHNIVEFTHGTLELCTTDEKTGITICMSKRVDEN